METRIDRAIQIYAGAGEWLRAVDAEGRFCYYLVPATGAPGRVWRTSADSCDCPDAEYRGVVCKHQWAVRLHEAALEERSDKQARARARAEARRLARATAAQAAELPVQAAEATQGGAIGAPPELPRIEGGRRIA